MPDSRYWPTACTSVRFNWFMNLTSSRPAPLLGCGKARLVVPAPEASPELAVSIAAAAWGGPFAVSSIEPRTCGRTSGATGVGASIGGLAGGGKAGLIDAFPGLLSSMTIRNLVGAGVPSGAGLME